VQRLPRAPDPAVLLGHATSRTVLPICPVPDSRAELVVVQPSHSTEHCVQQ
jgi:hypothetical protein